MRMTLTYGHAWVSMYGDRASGDAGKLWAETLSTLTVAQIKTGLEACARGGEWPPSMPKFRLLAIGVPSLAQAKHDLRTGNTTPFSKVMWRFLDGFVYRQATYRDADRMAGEAYEMAVAALTGGETLPDELQAALMHDHEAAARAEKEAYEKRHMQRMRELGAEIDA